MATTIKVQANQSILDVIVMATGSIEAGMQFCADNNISITDVPVAGTDYLVSDEALTLGDAEVRRYIVRNEIAIGTLANRPPCPAPDVDGIEGGHTVYIGYLITLTDATGGGVWSSADESIFTITADTGKVTGVAAGTAEARYTVTAGCGATTTVTYAITVMAVTGMRTILAPYLAAEYLGIGTPAASGAYSYRLHDGGDFVNVNALVSDYLGRGAVNRFKYQQAAAMISLLPPSIFTTAAGTPMTAKEAVIGIAYSTTDDLFVWNDDDETIDSVTFQDVDNNEAECSPVVIMNGSEADIKNYWLADLLIEFVSTDGVNATLRLTASNPGVGGGIGVTNTFTGAAAGGVPDPGDPSNVNKTFITVGAGFYTLGVETAYVLEVLPFTYPFVSRFSVCVEVF